MKPTIDPTRVTFEERVFQLLRDQQTDSAEFQVWKKIYGREKLAEIYRKYQELIRKDPHYWSRMYSDEDGWILLAQHEIVSLEPTEIVERGATMPGGAQYIKLKNHVQPSLVMSSYK